MVKSSAPIFVLMWAYLFGIERITLNLIFVVIIICIGEILTVTGEVDFHLGGFILCLSASILSGARWTLVQLKIRSMDPPLKTTIATMRLLAPSMFWSMLLVSCAVEQPWKKLANRTVEENVYDIFGLGMLGASFAIFMILCEFWLIMRTNAFVLMIGGVLKELITIFVGVSVFGDELNRVNISGCFVVFVGVIYYKFTHNSDAKEHAKREALAAMMQSPSYQRSRVGNDDDNNNNNTFRTDDDEHDMTTSLDHPQNDATIITSDGNEIPVARKMTLRSRSSGLAGLLSSTVSSTLYTKVMNDSSERSGADIINNSSSSTNKKSTVLTHTITNTNINRNNTNFVHRRLPNNNPSRALETGESTSESAEPIRVGTSSIVSDRNSTNADIC
jgi:Triose-phosphate Transporter family